MSLQTIILEKKEMIATIIFNRPDRGNSMNNLMREEFIRTLDAIEKNDGIRVVIITGSGNHFCTGVDLKTTSEIPSNVVNFPDYMHTNIHRPILRIRTLKKPVIAAVNGVAMGLGLNMATACDLRIAADTARFAVRFVKLGLGPGEGDTFMLPLLVGLGKANEIILTGDFIGGEEAERIGLVNKTVPLSQLKETTNELARKLAKVSPKGIEIAKAAINRWLLPQLQADLEYTAFTQSVLSQTEDHKEAMRAFEEKREPEFKGT